MRHPQNKNQNLRNNGKPPQNFKNYRVIPARKPAPRPTIPIKPIIIGIFLILLLTGIFIFKNASQERKTEKKLQAIQEKSNEVEYVEVDLASPAEVARAINNDKIQLVDIREETEFEIKHIESSINIPLSVIEEDIDLINKKLRVIIIDREDSPYGRVLTDHLKKEGVQSKYLEGGIVNYFNNDYPLINTGNPTQPEDLIKVTSIKTDQLLEMVFEGTRIALVDTRPAELFATGNIRGSINIPLEEVEKRKKEFPTMTILLYDENTMRSFRAAVRLHDLGFSEVYNCLDDYQTLNRRLNEELEKNKKEQPEETAPVAL